MPKKVFESIEKRLSAWIEQYNNTELAHQAKTLPLRRDMETLLTFVRDNKVIGTQSTGNMPLKSIREVTAHFVNPPELETTIGDQIFRVRSEIEVWPLYFLRILADVGGLLSLARARRWRLIPKGEKFLEAPPLFQVSFLLTVWWYKVNWLIYYPYKGMGNSLPPSFSPDTLVALLALPVETRTSFEEFADGLIEKTGLRWSAADKTFAPMILRGSISQIVIQILVDFGAIECEYQQEPFGKTTTSRLVAFEITPFGKILLEALVIVHDL